MLTGIVDILNWLAAGVMIPLMMLPLASFAGSRRAAAIAEIALVLGVAGAWFLFAKLAVEIDPPKATAVQFCAAMIGLVVLAAAIASAGARSIAAALSAPLEAIVRRTGHLALYLVMLMALVQFSAVILRYVFGLNFIAMQESVTYMHGAVFLFAGGYALLTDDHVRVDIFYRDASPRSKAMIDLAGTYLFLFPFCLVALWAAGPYVANSWAVREGSMEQSGIKGVFLLKTLIPIYLTLLACAGFVIAARSVAAIKSRSV